MKTINSISHFHRLLSLPEPLYPLMSVIRVENIQLTEEFSSENFLFNFYSVSLKRDVQAKIKYGQQYFDFDKGVMSFIAPKQIQSVEVMDLALESQQSGKGYALLFHPDFLYGHPLATTIKQYGFFSYTVNEALHLSEKEETDVVDIFQRMERECQHIDRHTQDILIAQLDLLLKYSNRFYERQFLVRKSVNNHLLTRMETLLQDYFDSEETLKNGLPTVDYLAGELNVSPHYLSDMLRTLTGQSAQQHIHEKLIEKAKQYLATSNLTVAEIAYELGFGHPQSFNKLFKKKTNMSPLEFRQGFN
ncbi:helix-turn-helix domain-containing protein [Xanthocytophaga flava]|uniref:helix-turn-helix domain-containing protein n=1 Tax=Xanthocytophaga flava TaxID=3048013 RepID=UPI0028D4976A|nr:helix-turn-helix transcriptional regulator [Xanthocytophaga flavus]MDJ1471893.1 helix-turn-helix transcriptional regulator [Xanthocytophaga flavus]